MRPLKFRAWDTVTKQWLEVGFHLFGEVTCFDIVRQKLVPNPAKPDEPSLIRLNDVIVTQFTGLHDRKGKEIYEGDVVRTPLNGDMRLVCFGEYVCENDDSLERDPSHLGWFLRGGEKSIDESLQGAPEIFEILGNRYEHPHLLDALRR